jgi:hypothetical protein
MNNENVPVYSVRMDNVTDEALNQLVNPAKVILGRNELTEKTRCFCGHDILRRAKADMPHQSEMPILFIYTEAADEERIEQAIRRKTEAN